MGFVFHVSVIHFGNSSSDGISGSRNLNDNSDSGVKNRVLSTFLNELDGVSGRDGVFVVAATNRIDKMDSALLRPGL